MFGAHQKTLPLTVIVVLSCVFCETPRAWSQKARSMGRSNPGILGRLFSGDSGRGGSTSSGERSAGTPASTIDPKNVDWTGVPFHQPRGQSGGATGPIVDPGKAAPRRAASGPQVTGNRSAPQTARGTPAPIIPGGVPKPPAPDTDRPPAFERRELEVGPTNEAFSETFSSRRSRRETVQPFELNQRSASDAVPVERPAMIANGNQNVGAAPQVSQRPIAGVTGDNSSDSVAGLLPVESDAARQVQKRAEPQAAAPAIPPSMQAVDRAPQVLADNLTGNLPMSDPNSADNADKEDKEDQAEASLVLENSGPSIISEPARPGSKNRPVGSGLAAQDSSNLSDSDDGWNSSANVSVKSQTPAGKATGEADPATQASQPKLANQSPPKTVGINSIPSEAPGLRVVAEGPERVTLRQPNRYELRVENRGSVNAAGVVVRAVLPAWVAVSNWKPTSGSVELESDPRSNEVLWQVEDLKAGEVQRLTMQLIPQQAGGFDVEVDWTLVPQQKKMLVQVEEPKLEILIDGPEEVVFGESATYVVRILNPGDGVAPGVVFTLSPQSPTPQAQRIGQIPPGKEAQFEVELSAQDRGDLQIHGLATGDLDLRAEASRTINVATADLEAILTGPPLRYQHNEAAYRLQVINNGKAISRNATASVKIPAAVEYLGGIDSAQISGGVLRWQIGELAPGQKLEYQLRCRMNQTGEHELAFQCRGSAAGEAKVALSTRVEAVADLVLQAHDPAAPAPVDAPVTYEIVLHNRGSKAATDVQVLAHFSDFVEPNQVSGHQGEISVGKVVFDRVDRIEPGQTLKLQIEARANREGVHRFRAEVTSGDVVLVAEESTRYLQVADEQISRRSSETSLSW